MNTVSLQYSPLRTLGPDWSHLPQVKAFTVLARDVEGNRITFKGPSPEAVRSRALLEEICGPVHWLNMVHGNALAELPQDPEKVADGVYTAMPAHPCAVTTADCLSVVFTNASGTRIGTVHAGWRGLECGIIGKMMAKFQGEEAGLLAWIGPGITQDSYETSEEVRQQFLARNPAYAKAFRAGNPGKYYADLVMIARMQLEAGGVLPENISGGNWDTFTNPDFHSARRDGATSGRMLAVVWIEGRAIE